MENKYAPGQGRSRPMEVLALGISRTGTASMALALERLGYKHCAHGLDMMDDADFASHWEKAVDAKVLGRGKPFAREDWDELLGHCAATTDMPCALFWRELCDVYPDARIVLVQRDEDKWLHSFSESVIGNLYTPSAQFTVNWVEPLLGSRLGRVSMKVLQGFLLGATDPVEMKRNARQAYRKHYHDIKATIPKGRILEYELGSGWAPLCAFLGKDVPTEDFPWINEADALKSKIEQVKKDMYTRALSKMAKFAAIFGVVGVAFAASRFTLISPASNV